MFLRLILMLLALLAAPAMAGTRAVFADQGERPLTVEIADNGDASGELTSGHRFVLRSGQAYIVEERWTGPIVTQVEDLAAIAAERHPPSVLAGEAPATTSWLVERGTELVNGRRGRAFFNRGSNELALVVSVDPVLARLAAIYRQMLSAEALLGQVEWQWPEATIANMRTDAELIGTGMPLKYWQSNLRSVETIAISREAVALPAEPESRAALRARLAREAAERGGSPSPDDMISRAVFAGGRLYLLSENGSLSSLAEGDRARARLDPGEPVLDICVEGGALLVLTGQRNDGARWTLRRWQGGQWQGVRSVDRAGDLMVALSCTAEAMILLTNRRLIDMRGGDDRGVDLRGGPIRTLVNAVVHATPDAVFVGINAGEWGGGLKRIDRRTGRIDTIERNATGGLCDGPLNTQCDPVQGIVTMPWRPECVAAAIGLIHMMAHGRIASVCPSGVEQLYAAAADIDPENARSAEDASRGRYGSVAFFGIAAVDGALVAAGHNGLYRIGAIGQASHRRWPRFVDVDGVLVTFAEPGFVLVLTGINGRASLSGAVPMLVAR
jgi:hypothetical protein